jgi:hypothetical protein
MTFGLGGGWYWDLRQSSTLLLLAGDTQVRAPVIAIDLGPYKTRGAQARKGLIASYGQMLWMGGHQAAFWI